MTPQEIFDRMYENDPFSRWMGMALVSVGEGACVLQMRVRPEMLNGFGVAHGAITFALADSAFAFACNSRGRHAVSIHCTVLTASASEDNLGKSLSHYAISVQNQDGKPVAFFRGVAFRKEQVWELRVDG